MSPLTIGVHGDWGYGKSSVLQMVQRELNDRKGVISLSFNGWAFEGFEDAKIALMDSVLSELATNRSIVTKAKDELVALARRVRWFKVARKVAGLAVTLSTGVPDFTKLIASGDASKEDDESLLRDAEEDAAFRHIHEFRRAFTEAINKAELTRLVIFVDDLDRCLPDTAIGTLEAIRLFLSVDKTVFVIGADEGMIEYSVRRHFPDLTASAASDKFTRNYLEKLIQIPIRLPQLTAGETRRYITLLLVEDALRQVPGAFDSLLQRVQASDRDPWKELDLRQLILEAAEPLGIDKSTRETLLEHVVLAGQIARPLADKYVGNPRQVKRFLNTLMIRIEVAKSYRLRARVKMATLAKLMLLERREPEAYTNLSRAVAESADGTVPQLAAMETAVRANDETAAEQSSEALFGRERSEWVSIWATIDPVVGGEDLAPYFFVSRERLVQFGVSDAISGELESLVRLFSSGQRLSVGRQQQRIDALSADNAGAILDSLIERVSQRGEYTAQPPEFRVLDVLLRSRPTLEARAVTFLDQLPISALGVWAPAFAVQIATSEASKPKLTELLKRWIAQTENATLAKAAEGAVQLVKAL